VSGLPEYEAQLRQTIADKQAVLTDVGAQTGKPFKYEAKLAEARTRCKELDEKLKASIEPPKPATERSEPAPGTVDPVMISHGPPPQTPGHEHPQPTRQHPPGAYRPSSSFPWWIQVGSLTRRQHREVVSSRNRSAGQVMKDNIDVAP
jgi:hypothetical protein